MYSREEIYQACLKLKPKVKKSDGRIRYKLYSDPFNCGLTVGFSEKEDYVWIEWAKREVFYNSPISDSWQFEHGIWEEYLMDLAACGGDVDATKRNCRNLETYSFVARYEQEMFSEICDTALFILEGAGVDRYSYRFKTRLAERIRFRHGSDWAKAVIEQTFLKGHHSILRIMIYDLWSYEEVKRKKLPLKYAEVYNAKFALDYDFKRKSIVYTRVDEFLKDSRIGRGMGCLELLFDWRDELAEKKKSSRRRKLTRKDCCRILGVPESATVAEIKKVFHRLALRYHPDGHSGQKWAEERFKEISEAYQVLTS